MEDKLDCLGVLPSLQHQLTNAEGAIQKLSALAPALESLQKVDFDALKTTMLGITKQIERSYAATKDGVIANVKNKLEVSRSNCWSAWAMPGRLHWRTSRS